MKQSVDINTTASVENSNAKNNSDSTKNRKYSRITSIILIVAIGAFGLYFLIFAINQWIRIGDLSKELADVDSKIASQEAKNEQLRSYLNTGYINNDEYVENKARQELNYIKPNEQIFINISGS